MWTLPSPRVITPNQSLNPWSIPKTYRVSATHLYPWKAEMNKNTELHISGSLSLSVAATMLSFFSWQATAAETQPQIWVEQVPPSPPLIPSTLICTGQPEPSESWQKSCSLGMTSPTPSSSFSLSSLSPFLWNCGKSKSPPVYPHLWIPETRTLSSITVQERLIVTERPRVEHCLSP